MPQHQENAETDVDSPHNIAETQENEIESPGDSVEGAQDIAQIDEKLEKLLEDLVHTFGESEEWRPFLLTDDPITTRTVDNVFDELQNNPYTCSEEGRLIVVVESGGGDIDAAYNLAMLFRRHGSKELIFVVPRWAKSAATLLVCGGDFVMMTPVAELGPLDPQITQINPMEQRVEDFSPLHIESTLEMIRSEFQQGNTQLANGLLQRLQFPITLGRFKKSLDICRQYSIKLLVSRMHRGKDKLVEDIANKLVEEYADHGFCINIDEAKDLGLKVCPPSSQQLTPIWEIHKLVRKKTELIKEQKERELRERLKEMPFSLQTESLPKSYDP